VKKMVEMIRLAYSSTIDQTTWMDENTLLYALVKNVQSSCKSGISQRLIVYDVATKSAVSQIPLLPQSKSLQLQAKPPACTPHVHRASPRPPLPHHPMSHSAPTPINCLLVFTISIVMKFYLPYCFIRLLLCHFIAY
ncbi:hypothetical protein AVEN_239183-1, partial [Araneus ventricosus]